MISEVQQGSPAENSGLKRGDVLTEINDRKVTSVNDVKNTIGLLRVGEQIEIRFVREKQPFAAEIYVGESELSLIKGEQLAAHLDGAVFENAQWQKESVVVVNSVRAGSSIDRYGLQRGDVVLSVNRMLVETVEDMIDAVALRERSSLLDIQRGNLSQLVLVQ